MYQVRYFSGVLIPFKMHFEVCRFKRKFKVRGENR